MARKSTRRSSSSNTKQRGKTRTAASASIPMYSEIMSLMGSLMHNRQAAGASTIGSLADAARGFATDLADNPRVKTYVNSAADQIESLSDYVSENSLEQMLEDATSVAKRYPVATASLAIAAGYGFTRLMTNGRDDQTRSNKSTRSHRSATNTNKSSKSSRKRTSAAANLRSNGNDTSHDRAKAS